MSEQYQLENRLRVLRFSRCRMYQKLERITAGCVDELHIKKILQCSIGIRTISEEIRDVEKELENSPSNIIPLKQTNP